MILDRKKKQMQKDMDRVYDLLVLATENTDDFINEKDDDEVSDKLDGTLTSLDEAMEIVLRYRRL